MDLKYDMKVWTGCMWLRKGTSVGSIKGHKYLEQVNEYRLL